MKKLLLMLLFLAVLPAVAAAEDCGEVKCQHVAINLGDKVALQRGARIFVNYCLSCHSASYMRFNRMGKDLGIPLDLVKSEMMFTGTNAGATMKVAMRSSDAAKWFGMAPPDLSDEARYRGPDWVYTYLLSFYRDNATASGWNNAVFPHVAMPDVLSALQGQQHVVYKTVQVPTYVEQGGKQVLQQVPMQVFDHLEIEKPGRMTPQQYASAMHDLVNFMVYLAEPAKLIRYRIGVYVLIFLAVFLVFAYLLKKEYWKDIH